MLEFSEKLTLKPSAMTSEDVEDLRRHGFSDRDILSITLAAAYRNFITRVADALGVELRKGGSYAAQILEAFSVTEAEARTTIYSDRLERPKEGCANFRHKNVSGSAQFSSRGSCWISTIPSNAQHFGRLCEEADKLPEPYPIRNLALAFALRPEALQATIEFGRLLGMEGSGLGQRLEVIIGVTVSAALDLFYLAAHYAQMFLHEGGTREELKGLIENPQGGTLSGREREVARFCEQLTHHPSTMARADVEALRQCGFADRDIVTIAASTAFENFLSRVAAGLGVTLEETVWMDSLKSILMEAQA